jgi:hypothetical protein
MSLTFWSENENIQDQGLQKDPFLLAMTKRKMSAERCYWLIY